MSRFIAKMEHRHLAGSDEPLMNQIEDWDACLKKVGETQDKDAFSTLFEHYSPLLKSFLMRVGSMSVENAEELVQETMVKIWRKSPTFNPAHASAGTWIYTIARNTRVDWIRKQIRQDPEALHADDIYEDIEGQTPYSTLARIRRNSEVSQQLNELPPEQSDVLQMMYFQGMSGQQVAESMGLPLGTVKSRIRLALAKLKIGLAPTHQSGSELEGIRND